MMADYNRLGRAPSYQIDRLFSLSVGGEHRIRPDSPDYAKRD